MRTTMLVMMTVAALAFVGAVAPAATADHDGCSGDPALVAACGWHHGPHECFTLYAGGEPVQGSDVC